MMESDSTHYLKVGETSASSRMRFSQRVNRLIFAPPVGDSPQGELNPRGHIKVEGSWLSPPTPIQEG